MLFEPTSTVFSLVTAHFLQLRGTDDPDFARGWEDAVTFHADADWEEEEGSGDPKKQ